MGGNKKYSPNYFKFLKIKYKSNSILGHGRVIL